MKEAHTWLLYDLKSRLYDYFKIASNTPLLAYSIGEIAFELINAGA